MIRIAICDDNTIFLKNFKKLVEDGFTARKAEYSIQTYTSGKLLANHHTERMFDVIFLDIDMPNQTGFDVIRSFREDQKEYVLVFVTSHSEFVFDSFLFRPLNFITKTNYESMRNRLHMVIDQIMEVLKQETVVVLEDKELGRNSVVLRRIIYIESNRHNVIYHLEDLVTKISVRNSLTVLENEYQKYDFIRVHRKYIVNLKHVFNIDLTNELIMLKQNIGIPLSRNYKHIVDQRLTDYLRRIK